MADHSAKITIEGDSRGAVDALEEVKDGLTEASEEVERLSETAEELATTSTTVTSSLNKVSDGAGKLGNQASASGRQLKSLSGALSAISPEAGAAVSAISGLSGGLSGLVGVINPATIAIGALGAAVTLGVKAWQDHKAAQEAAAESMRRVAEETRRMGQVTRELSAYQGNAAQDLLGFIEGLDGASDAVRRLREEQTAAARDAAYEAMRKEADDAARQITVLVNRQLELTDQTQALARSHGIASREYQQAAAALERIQTVIGLVQARNKDLLANVRDITSAYEEARTRGFVPATEAINDSADAARAAIPSYRELADQATRLAAAGDVSGIVQMLRSGGDAAREMASALGGASSEALTMLGVTDEIAQSVERINFDHRTTADVLRDLQSEVDAYADAMREAEASASAQAFDARAFDERLAAQDAWLAHVSMGYEEQLAHEAELLESAMLAAQTRQELNEQQMDALTEYYDRLRAEQAEAVAAMEEMSVALQADVVQDGIASITSAVSTMSTAFANAAIGGEQMGEALGKAALKSIGQIAMQFGTLFMTTALGMAFMPGFQGNAAGLAAGGAALTLLGASLGAAAGKIGKAPSKASESSAQSTSRGIEESSTVVVDTFSRAQSYGGRGARDFGEREGNADRYGINRGRAWA